jgi:hypothetical protein
MNYLHRAQISRPFHNFPDPCRRFSLIRIAFDPVFFNNLAASIFRILFKKFRAGIPACPTADTTLSVYGHFQFSCHRLSHKQKGNYIYPWPGTVVIVLAGILIYDIFLINTMSPSQIYIAISIAVLAIIALLVFFVNKNKKEKKLSKLAGLSFAFIIAGIIFGDDRLIGYSLIGVGVILAIIDIIEKSKSK